MKKVLLSLLAVVGPLCYATASRAEICIPANPVVQIYTGFQDTGGGAPYSGLAGQFTSPLINFGTTTGFNWHPFGLGKFGADITSYICVPAAAAGVNSFYTTSDDGSLLLIDNTLVVNNGGPHGIATVTTSTILTPGTHKLEVQFFEDFGGPSGVDAGWSNSLIKFGALCKGTPVPANVNNGLCREQCLASLNTAFGGITNVVAALGYTSPDALKATINASCTSNPPV